MKIRDFCYVLCHIETFYQRNPLNLDYWKGQESFCVHIRKNKPDHSAAVRERTDAYFQEKLILHIREGRGALYPNVKAVFDYLRECGISIYIASNGLPDYLQAIVSYYRLDNWVAETCSIQRIHSLNKSDLVKSILEKHQITKAAVVGDRLSDF